MTELACCFCARGTSVVKGIRVRPVVFLLHNGCHEQEIQHLSPYEVLRASSSNVKLKYAPNVILLPLKWLKPCALKLATNKAEL